MSQDSELDTYLQGKTDLSRLYADAPQIEPPDHLDAAILAEAHRAVNARPGARSKRRWAIPLGLVASLFAVVMIGLQLPYMLKESVPIPAPTEAKVTAATDESAAAPALRAQNERMKILTSDRARSEIAGNKPAPAAAEASVQPAAPMTAAPMAAAPAPAMAAKRLEMRESAEIANTRALAEEKKSANAGESNINDSFRRAAPAAGGIVAPSPIQFERALKQDAAGEIGLRPEEWLTRIKKLKQEGKQEEAKKELAAFKKRYPDYPVPSTLEIR
jgi:hypothetical protein